MDSISLPPAELLYNKVCGIELVTSFDDKVPYFKLFIYVCRSKNYRTVIFFIKFNLIYFSGKFLRCDCGGYKPG